MIEWMKQNPGYTFLIIFFAFCCIEKCVDNLKSKKGDGE